MTPRASLLRRPRVLAEARFALGAALAGAGVGLALALMSPSPDDPGVPSAPFVSRWIGALAPTVVTGWWAGLLWAVAALFHARGWQPQPPVERLGRSVWLAAALVMTGGALAAWVWSAPGWGAVAGLAAATAALRPPASRAPGRAAR
jgi:hypothetical protein